ncbi:MAG: efflux RND transporter periplasmic adaptor subunit [Opitutus sp.]|nr:efflux RND transporter periplasmic adaptor subunit [Opitutus sp.]
MNPASVVPPPAATRVAAGPPKKSKTLWYGLGAIVLIVGIGAGAYYKKKWDALVIAVTTEKAIVKTITQIVTATGKVQPEMEVKISPEVAGEIIALGVKEGDAIKKGDLLVKIKPDFYQAQLEQAEANLTATKAGAVQAKAQLLKAQDDFKRSADLFAKKLISDSDYAAVKTTLEVAEANHDNALAQIRRTEGSLSQAKDQLSKTIIFAPMNGTVSSLTSEVGERVVGTGTYAGTEIMRVADLSNMELRVQVNENDIVNVKIGDHAIINIDAYPARKFGGTVSEISSSAQTIGGNSQQTADVSNFLVKIRVTERDVQLRPGMSATTDIETQTVENVIAVPIQSVTVRAEGGLSSDAFQKKKAKDAENKSGTSLDVAAEREAARRDREKLQRVIFLKLGDKVKMQKVETGIADNTHIQVKSGVKPGDEVVAGSYAAISRKLKDDKRVRIEVPKKEEDEK